MSINEDIDVEHLFKYHAPDEKQIVKYTAIRDTAKGLARVLIQNTPCGADQYESIRKLRECVMLANASIALEKNNAGT